MKKFFVFAFLLALLASVSVLVSCSDSRDILSENSMMSNVSPSASENELSNKTAYLSSIQYWGETNGSIGAGCGNDDGYYYWQERGDTNATLMYIDYASKKAFPLCAQPECAHSDNACTSWLGWRGGHPQLISNENNLLLVYANSDTEFYEQYKEKALAHIDMAELNGAEKRTLVTLQPNQNLQLGVACDNTNAFIIITTAKSADELNTALYSVSLADGTLTELYALPKGASFITGAYERNVVVKTFSAPKEGNLYSENDTQTFFCINADTKECVNQKEIPFQKDASALQTFVKGIKLYCFSPAQNTLTVESLQTGEQLNKTEQVFDRQIQYGKLERVYGSRVVFSEAFLGEENPSSIWLDIESGARGQLTLTGSYDASGHSGFLIMPSWNKDGLMLAVYRTSSKIVVITNEKGASSEAVTFVPDYAFISEQDFFSGNANFEPTA